MGYMSALTYYLLLLVTDLATCLAVETLQLQSVTDSGKISHAIVNL